MFSIKDARLSLLHLLFPHLCCGCSTDILAAGNSLCVRCISELPETNFCLQANNPVEKIFWGRLPIVAATAQYYFTKQSVMQQVMHEFKYKGNKLLGKQLGNMIGEQLLNSGRFIFDVIIPMPLHPKRQRQRGYNQATLLSEGMSGPLNRPVLNNVIIRKEATASQTRKGRLERWETMEGKFLMPDPQSVTNKHILLVDDVVTTGATLEACANELLKAGNVRISIATLCYAAK